MLIGLGYLPLLYWHVTGLLERPHYQFLFLFPVAAGFLYASLPEAEFGKRTTITIFGSLVVLSLSLAGLAFAAWAWSPWIAAVSAVICLPAVFLFYGGWPLLKTWYPMCVFSVILIPLPFGMDEDLIVRLRTVTCRATSAVLDQIGVLHGAFANVIELPGKPLFVADACSGIHSLYVLLAMALFLATYTRRTAFHSVMLLLSTFGLVLVENITRIASVAVAWRFGWDWSEGASHTMLGAALFCVSAGLILSMDQLLLFLLPKAPLLWLQNLFPKRKLRTEKLRKPSDRNTEASPGIRGAWLTVAILFPVLGVYQLTRLPSDSPNFMAAFEDEFSLARLSEDVFPSDVHGFTRTDFQTIDRVDEDPFGKSSQRWTFTNDSMTVHVSLDYPYEGPKDLCQCYELVGWKVEQQKIWDLDEIRTLLNVADAVAPVASAELHREFYGDAFLVFSSCDLKGNITALIKDVVRGDSEKRVADRFRNFGAQQEVLESGTPLSPPYINVHLIADSVDPLTTEDRHEILRLFLELRNVLVAEVVKSQTVLSGTEAKP